MPIVDIVDTPIDVYKLHEAVKHPQAGAVVLFSGITRDSFEGKHVKLLSYDCYKPRALRTLNEIAHKAETMPGVKGVALVHRIGEVPLSSESVVIAVAAAHRREGWDAGEWVLEEVKRQVEIWKQEVYEDDTVSWINGCERCRK